MPLQATSAKGTVGLMIEGTSGEVSILPATAGAATINSGFTQPSGSTGMRLHVLISGWLTSGTFTITGTGTPGNSEGPITVAAPTAQQTQSPQLANFEYVTTNAYTAITSITTTGGLSAANTTFVVKGIQASKFLIPVTAFKSQHKVPIYSPNEHSGLMARDKKLIATHNEATIDTFDSDYYGDLSMYWVYMLLGIPTFVTLPAAPLSVVASATIVASMTIANQPTAPGMKLIIVASGFTGNPSITISGTSYGVATSEVVTITANGTYYSANVYSALTSIGGTTNGTTLVITGVFGWKATVTSEATRQTAAVEHFDGSASWTHPFVCATDGDVTISTKAEAKLTMKCIAQDKLPIGDRTTNPLQTNRTTSLGTPLSDLPVAGWQTLISLDPITGTAGATPNQDIDEEIKIVVKAPVEPHWTFANLQEFSRAYPIKPEYTVECTYDVLNLLQFEQFRQELKQYLNVAMIGEYIGTTGGTNYFKGWTWTLPVRYDGEYAQEGQPSKGNTFAKAKLRCEYDAGLGGALLLTIITRTPPNYSS